MQVKKVAIILICAVLCVSLASCGGKADEGRRITVVSEKEGATVSTCFFFTGDKLDRVTQRMEYDDPGLLEQEYESVKSNTGYFSNVVRSGGAIEFEMTEKCLSEFYQDADYDWVVKSAEENGLKIITE